MENGEELRRSLVVSEQRLTLDLGDTAVVVDADDSGLVHVRIGSGFDASAELAKRLHAVADELDPDWGARWYPCQP